LTSFALLLGWLSPVVGQDLLDRVKAANEIAAQKMEAEVKDALVEAQKLAGSDPAKALERLRKTLGNLQADRALTAARRDLLTRQIQDRIKTAEVEAERFARRQAEKNDKLIVQDQKSKEIAERNAETERVSKTLDYINALQKEGKNGEATKVAEELFKRHPNLAAPQVVGRTSTILDQVATLRSMKGDGDGRRLAALTNVERSALHPGSDMEFPKDWAQKVKIRQPINQSYLTAKDKEILKALSTPMSVDFKDTSFNDAIQYLSDKMGQPILLDKQSLADAGVSSETLVTLQVKGLTGRTALRKILGDLGLAYIIKGEAIQVVTEKVAKETLVTRTYFLGSLLAGGTFSDAGIRFVPGLNQFEAMQNVLSIVNLIQSSVDPQSWQANGGLGTISFHAPTMSLIIRNTAEVHGMMGGYVK
jgi:hypothetical protein